MPFIIYQIDTNTCFMFDIQAAWKCLGASLSAALYREVGHLKCMMCLIRACRHTDKAVSQHAGSVVV